MLFLLIGRIGLFLCIFGLSTHAQNPGGQAIPCERPQIRNLGSIVPEPDLGGRAYTPGTVITISCIDGLVLEGSSTLTCGSRVWQTSPQGSRPPICRVQPPVVPSPASNLCRGQCTPNSDCAVIDGQLGCVCRSGYTPVDETCRPDAGSAAPVCRGGCPVANSICAIFQGAPRCICAVGFIEVGRSCQSRTLVQPTPGRCGGACPQNSQCSLFGSNQPACVCDPGYLVFLRTSCTPRPSAPSAPVDGCRRPRISPNRNILPNNNQQVWLTGAIIIYSCDSGYILNGRRRARCGENGRFTSPPPTCSPPVTPRTTQPPAPTQAVIVRCRAPRPPVNGFIRPRQTVFAVGQQVQFLCRPPLTNRGDTTAVCETSGQFSAANPVCVAVQPTVPPSVAPSPATDLCNGQCTDNSDCALVDGQARCVCRFGYTPVSGSCQRQGIPTRPIPTRPIPTRPIPTRPTPTRCLPPTLPISGFIFPQQVSYAVGQRVQFRCRAPLTNRGDTSAICQRNGQFSAANPQCVAVQPVPPSVDPNQGNCVIPIAPNNGVLVNPSDSWTIGSIAEYRCNTGFRLVGFARTRCLQNGLFNSPPPICQPGVTCPLPVVPFGGSIDTPNKLIYVPFDRVTYTCGDQYTLIGNPVIVCRRDGSYSSPFPSCGSVEEMATAGPVMCLNPTVPSNGYTAPRGQTVWTPGTEVGFVCNDGYDLAGATSALCRNDGTFEQTTTFCIRTVVPTPPTTCSRPENPVNGFVVAGPTKLSWQVGENIRYDCNSPYTINGERSAVCQSSGSFPAPPICEIVTAPPIDCPRPTPPRNGIIVGDTGRQSWQVGDQLEWGCSSPYILAGDRIVTCQENGGFGFTPICVEPATAPPITVCARLATPTNGEILASSTQQTWQIGENLLFNCFFGFNLVGNEFVTCQNDGSFNGVTPACQPVVASITCSEPPRPTDGFIINSRATYNEGDVIMFGCNNGFELIGSPETTCENNGRFSGFLPICRAAAVAVTCSVPPSPTNGFIQNPQNTYNENAVISFRCNDGYELVGSSEATCQSNGRFTGFLPTCREIVVVVATCSVPPSPTNGFIQNPQNSYNENAVISFRCNDGYELVGSSESTCQSNGRFTGFLPTCRVVVVAVICLIPPSPNNGFIVSPRTTNYNENDVIIFGCNNGYELAGSATSTCQADGTFSGFLPSCRAIVVGVTCQVPPSPTNGFIVNPQNTYNENAVITFDCNGGYELVGSAESTCQSNGRFTGFLPSCLELATPPSNQPCPPPQIPLFGSIDNPQTSYSFGSLIRFRCQSGYNLQGPSIATCGQNGQFTGGNRVCRVISSPTPSFITCRAPVISFGSIVNGQANYNLGDVISFVCNAPFTLDGPATATCLGTGEFSELPRCQVTISGVRCPVSPPDGGVVVGGFSSVQVGVVVQYDCNPPYQLLGESTSVCQAGGTLQFPPPVCTECIPRPPQNGFTVGDRNVWRNGDLITYDCLPGYVLVGLAPSLCQANGEILGNPPTCRTGGDNELPTECEVGTLVNGRVLFNNTVTTRVPVGRLFNFECNSGYRLIGPPAAICLQSLEVTDFPSCMP